MRRGLLRGLQEGWADRVTACTLPICTKPQEEHDGYELGEHDAAAVNRARDLRTAEARRANGIPDDYGLPADPAERSRFLREWAERQ